MFNEEELKKVKEKALEEHIPILMDDTLEKIEEILKEEKPKRILEIGTAVGYSASTFARVTSNDCIIDTIELSEERAKEAKENVEKIGVSNISLYKKSSVFSELLFHIKILRFACISSSSFSFL